jgi:hypothetical protein
MENEKLERLRLLIDGMLMQATEAQLREDYKLAAKVMANVERLEKRYEEEKGKVKASKT